MNQNRVRGRGRGYRNFRNDTQRPNNDVIKPSQNISHPHKKCCQEITTNFDLDQKGAAFFQDLKIWWNMCE